MNSNTILAISTILASSNSINVRIYCHEHSVVAQEMTGDKATMSGNMTGGNVTGGNTTGSISSYIGPDGNEYPDIDP